MLEFNNLKEIEPYLDEKSNTYLFDDDVRFFFDLKVNRNIAAQNIVARDINAQNINARDINARNINARNINAWNINACNINAWNIDACNINAWNIDTRDINARDINAWNIDARDIDYYAVCIAYQRFICRSVQGARENALHACLDGEIEYKEMGVRNEKGEAAHV